jgi:hypothetical protein
MGSGGDLPEVGNGRLIVSDEFQTFAPEAGLWETEVDA